MLITKYKFNNTLYDFFPEFNSGFEFTYTDEVNGEVTTRTIESDTLPTLMRFGRVYVDGELSTDNRTDSLLEVLDINTSGLTDCLSMFRYSKNLTSISCEWDTSNVITMNGMFNGCNSLASLDVSNFNTSNVTNMRNMFFNCINLTSLDVSNFNTSNVTSMEGMFFNCNKLTLLDVSNFNTSNVTSMVNMFNSCNKLTTLSVSSWNTSNVTNMNGIFAYCNNLTTLEVSSWNTSKVTNMYQMFRDCSSLVSLDVSRFDTSKVTTMYCMFYNCRNLTELDVSNFNTSNVESMYSMFCNCIKLLFLDISKWDTSNVTNIDYMFGGYNYDMNLVSLDINNFSIDNVSQDYSHLFERMPYLKYLKCKNTNVLNILLPYLPTKSSTSQGTIICKSDVTNLDTTSLQSKYWNILDELTLVTKYVFDKSIHNNYIPTFNTEFEGYFIEDVEVEGNEVTRVIESCGMLPTTMRFGNSLGNLALKKLLDINTSEVTEMRQMFFGCKKLSSICGDKFNTSKVTRLEGMFYDCNSLKVIDISSWDVSNVTSTYCMFQYCNNLISVGDLSNWNTSKITDLGGMFLNCMTLASLNISSWDVSNVTNMWQMFYYCYSLTSLDLSNWDMGKVTNMNNTFVQTTNLKDIGMLYCNASTIQKIINAMPTDLNKTLWYKETNIDGITYNNNIALKKYIEENIEIVLNSPLLEGDTIEVVDGKLCHVYRYGKVVLDGSENWTTWANSTNPDGFSSYYIYYDTALSLNALGVPRGNTKPPLCDKLISNKWSGHTSRYVGINSVNGYLTITLPHIELGVDNNTTKDDRLNSFKQWLQQASPITVVYEIAEPYYEEITPCQSSLALRTFEECNVQIITALPIKTKITYRTNITSAVVLEQELDTLDSGVSLSNLIEEEVDE